MGPPNRTPYHRGGPFAVKGVKQRLRGPLSAGQPRNGRMSFPTVSTVFSSNLKA